MFIQLCGVYSEPRHSLYSFAPQCAAPPSSSLSACGYERSLQKLEWTYMSSIVSDFLQASDMRNWSRQVSLLERGAQVLLTNQTVPPRALKVRQGLD